MSWKSVNQCGTCFEHVWAKRGPEGKTVYAHDCKCPIGKGLKKNIKISSYGQNKRRTNELHQKSAGDHGDNSPGVSAGPVRRGFTRCQNGSVHIVDAMRPADGEVDAGSLSVREGRRVNHRSGHRE